MSFHQCCSLCKSFSIKLREGCTDRFVRKPWKGICKMIVVDDHFIIFIHQHHIGEGMVSQRYFNCSDHQIDTATWIEYCCPHRDFHNPADHHGVQPRSIQPDLPWLSRTPTPQLWHGLPLGRPGGAFEILWSICQYRERTPAVFPALLPRRQQQKLLIVLRCRSGVPQRSVLFHLPECVHST